MKDYTDKNGSNPSKWKKRESVCVLWGGFVYRKEKSHNHLPLVCTRASPAFLEWMSLIWEDTYSHRNRGVKDSQKTLIDLCHCSPAALREACHVACTCIQAYLPRSLRLSDRHVSPLEMQHRCLATSWSKFCSGASTLHRGWHSFAANAKDDRRKREHNICTRLRQPAFQCS